MMQGLSQRGCRQALFALGCVISALFAATLALADVAIPPLKARVTDLTATLSAQQQAALEEKLRAFETRKGSQIAVLVVPKSTFGGVAIAFSFSTVNCGFSLKPKIIATRLFGNCTTVVLYSCTDLM